jgi:hypothetical protein
MTAFLMICVPLLVLAMVAGAVLVWAYKRVPQSPVQQPYDAGEGDVEDLEIEAHLGRKGAPGLTHAEWLASHAPSEQISDMNKALYVGVFAGGEHGDEAIASYVKDIEIQRKNADELRALVRQQALSDRRARRWAWLPWRAYARWQRQLAITAAEHHPGQITALQERIRYLDDRLHKAERRLAGHEAALQPFDGGMNGQSLPSSWPGGTDDV